MSNSPFLRDLVCQMGILHEIIGCIRLAASFAFFSLSSPDSKTWKKPSAVSSPAVILLHELRRAVLQLRRTALQRLVHHFSLTAAGQRTHADGPPFSRYFQPACVFLRRQLYPPASAVVPTTGKHPSGDFWLFLSGDFWLFLSLLGRPTDNVPLFLLLSAVFVEATTSPLQFFRRESQPCSSPHQRDQLQQPRSAGFHLSNLLHRCSLPSG